MPWVPIREAAEDLLKVSRRTVERLVKSGSLRSKFVQRRRLVLVGADDDPEGEEEGRDLSPELCEELFDAFEGLSALLTHSFGIMKSKQYWEKVFACLPEPVERPTAAQWRDLSEKIKSCRKGVEDMVRERRCPTRILQQIYRSMVLVRLTWAGYARIQCSNYGARDAPLGEKKDPLALMTSIIGHLRRLLAGCGSHGNSGGDQALS